MAMLLTGSAGVLFESQASRSKGVGCEEGGAQKSLSELEEAEYGCFFFFVLILRVWLFPGVAGTLLGVLEVVEDGAFGDAEDVPDAVEVGLVLVLHAPEAAVDGAHAFLDGLHLQLHEGRDALVEGGVVDLLLDALALLAHEAVHLAEGHVLLDLLRGQRAHGRLDLAQDAVVVLDQLAQLVLHLLPDQLHDALADLLHQLRQRLAHAPLLRAAHLSPHAPHELRVLDQGPDDGCRLLFFGWLFLLRSGGCGFCPHVRIYTVWGGSGGACEECVEEVGLLLLEAADVGVGGLLEGVDADVAAHGLGVVAHELQDEGVEVRRLDVLGRGAVGVVDEHAQHPHVLRVDHSPGQHLHVVPQPHAQPHELRLLPLHVLVEDLHDAFEVQRKHEQPIGVDLLGEAVAQQEFVVVECAVGEGGGFAGQQVPEGADAEEGRFAVREVEEVEVAVGGAGVLQPLHEGRCELEALLPRRAHHCLPALARPQELLLLRPLQQLLPQVPERHPVPHFPALVQLEQEPRVDVGLGDCGRLAAQHELGVVPQRGLEAWSRGLGVGDELEVDAHAGEVVLVHGLVLAAELLQLLAHLALLGRGGARESCGEQALLRRQQQQVVPPSDFALADYPVPLLAARPQRQRVVHLDVSTPLHALSHLAHAWERPNHTPHERLRQRHYDYAGVSKGMAE